MIRIWDLWCTIPCFFLYALKSHISKHFTLLNQKISNCNEATKNKIYPYEENKGLDQEVPQIKQKEEAFVHTVHAFLRAQLGTCFLSHFINYHLPVFVSCAFIKCNSLRGCHNDSCGKGLRSDNFWHR